MALVGGRQRPVVAQVRRDLESERDRDRVLLPLDELDVQRIGIRILELADGVGRRCLPVAATTLQAGTRAESSVATGPFHGLAGKSGRPSLAISGIIVRDSMFALCCGSLDSCV